MKTFLLSFLISAPIFAQTCEVNNGVFTITCPQAQTCASGYSCQPNPVSTDLGQIPFSINKPAKPVTTRAVEVLNAAQLLPELSKSGSKITIKGSIDQDIVINGNDMELIVLPGITLRKLSFGDGKKRIRVEGGSYISVQFASPISFWPTVSQHPENMNEDITLDSIKVTGAPIALSIKGKRIHVLNSDIEALNYSVWVGDTQDIRNQDLFFSKNKFHSTTGAEATFRAYTTDRLVLIDSRLQNGMTQGGKHNYRLHGVLNYAYAARNVLVNSGVMLGTMAGDTLDHIWFNDNVVYHNTPDLFNIGNVLTMEAKGNKAYTNAWNCFYCQTPKTTWDFSNNLRLPYQVAP